METTTQAPMKLTKAEKIEKAALLKIKKAIDKNWKGNDSALSRESGLTSPTIANLRKGEGINPSIQVLSKLFATLNLSFVDVFGSDKKAKENEI